MDSHVQCCGWPELTYVATASRGMVLVVMSGAHLLDLKERKVYATGYYRSELYTPLAALVKAGCTPVFANPKWGTLLAPQSDSRRQLRAANEHG